MLTEKPWRAEALMLLLLGAMGCYMLSSLWLALGAGGEQHVGGALRLAGATVTFQGAATVMLWYFARHHALTVREAFGLNLNTTHAIILGITVGLIFVPIEIGVQNGIQMIANWLNLKLPEQSAVTMVRLADTLPERIALGFMTIVAAPVAEEGLFRGVFYTALRRSVTPGAALLITSLAFALIHASVAKFIPLVVLAVGLTKLYDRTGNLLSCIACHATFNAFNFVLLMLVKDSPMASQ